MPAATQPLDSQLQISIAQWGVSLQTDPKLWTLSDDPEVPGQQVALASLSLPNGRVLSVSRYGVDSSRPFNPAEKAGLADGSPLMFACIQDRTPTGSVFLNEDVGFGPQMAEASLDTDATPSQVVLAAIQKWGGELQAGPGLLTASSQTAQVAAAPAQAPAPVAPAMAPELEARVREWATQLETNPSMWTLLDDDSAPGEKIAIAAFRLPGTRLLNVSRYGIDVSQPFNPAQAAEISIYEGQPSPLMYATIQDKLPSGTQFLMEMGVHGEQMAEASLLAPSTPSQVVDAAIAKWGIALQQGPGAPDLTAQAAQEASAKPIQQSAAPAPALTPAAPAAAVTAVPAAVSAAAQDLDGYADIAAFSNEAYDADADEVAAANAAASAMAIQAHAPQPIPPHNPPAPFLPINDLDGMDEPAPQPEITPISPETPEGIPGEPQPEITPGNDPIIVPPQAPVPTPEIPVVPPTMMAPADSLEKETSPPATQEEAVLAPVVAEIAPAAETPATLPQTEALHEETIAAAAQGRAVEAPKAANSRHVLLLTGAIAGLSLAAPAVVATLGVAAAAYVANNLRTQSKAVEEAPFLTRFGKAIGLAVGMVARAAREESGHVRLVALAKAREAQTFARGEAERAAGALRQTGREIKMGVDLAIDPLREAGKEFGRGVEITIDPIRSAAKVAQTGARRARISLSFLAAEGLDSIARAQERVAHGVDAAGDKRRALKTRATLAILSARAQFHDAQTALRQGLSSVGHAIDRALDQSMNPAAGDSRAAVYSALYGPAVGANLPAGGLTGFGADIAADRFDARQQRSAAKAQAERQEPQFAKAEQPAQPTTAVPAPAASTTPVPAAASPAPVSTPAKVADPATTAAQTEQALGNFRAISDARSLQAAVDKISQAASSGVDLEESEFALLQKTCAKGVMPAQFPVLPTISSLQDTPFAQASAVLLARSAQTIAFAKQLNDLPPERTTTNAEHVLSTVQRMIASNATSTGPCVRYDSAPLDMVIGSLMHHVTLLGNQASLEAPVRARFEKSINDLLELGAPADSVATGASLLHWATNACWIPVIDALISHGATPTFDIFNRTPDDLAASFPESHRGAVQEALDRGRFSLPDPTAIAERARSERAAKAMVATAQAPSRPNVM